MPRTARASKANYCYHVINRANARSEVFHKVDDFAAFVELMELANQRIAMRVLGYCLMPDHFHLVLWPRQDGDLSRWMQWLLTSQVRRYHSHYKSSGHIWQGRFRAFPIQEDEHLSTVLRFVEQNPLRANLAEKAQNWPWSSLYGLARSRPEPLLQLHGPMPRGADWVRGINRRMPEAQLTAMRHAIARGCPYGSDEWATETARDLGLESSMRPRGRPKK
jgi:putative transposase